MKLFNVSFVPQKRRWINAGSSAPYIDTNKNSIGTIYVNSVKLVYYPWVKLVSYFTSSGWSET
jgi:hypothetical protein